MPVDAGVLWLMTHRAGLDPYSGRVISWLFAARLHLDGQPLFHLPRRRARTISARRRNG